MNSLDVDVHAEGEHGKKNKSKWHFINRFILIICIGIILYVLSTGPILSMFFEYEGTPSRYSPATIRAVQWFYSPITWLCSKSETLNIIFQWYTTQFLRFTLDQ
jgi:hypothetical protein